MSSKYYVDPHFVVHMIIPPTNSGISSKLFEREDFVVLR